MKNDRIIVVKELQNNFGSVFVAPVCDVARYFTALTGTDYLDEKQLYIIERLGFTIKTEYQTKEEHYV